MSRNMIPKVLCLVVIVSACVAVAAFFRYGPSPSEPIREEAVAASQTESEHASNTNPPVEQKPVTTNYPVREWVHSDMPGEEMLENGRYWRDLLYRLEHLYPMSFDRETAIWGGKSHLASTILQQARVAERLPQTVDEYGETYLIVSPEELRALLDLYYGSATVESTFDDPYDLTYDSDGNILLHYLPFELQGDPQHEIVEVVAVDGMRKIRLEAEKYEGGTIDSPRRLDSLHTYELYWDEHVGYVPSRILWEYAPTDQVTIQGDVTGFDTLWGQTADAQTLLYGFDPDDSKSLRALQTIGETVYRFAFDGGDLLADTLDLVTLEQQTGVRLQSFDEPITQVRFQDGQVLVYTDTALSLLDHRFEQVDRRLWPQALPEDHRDDAVLHNDISLVSYATDEGLLLCAMEPEAQPRLLAEHPVRWEDVNDSEEFISYESLFPIRFLDDDRLFVGVHMWESIGYFLVMDLNGAELDRISLTVTGAVAGGYYKTNKQDVLFFAPWAQPDSEQLYNYTYRFATEQLERADWIDLDRYNETYRCIPDPSDPGVWYLSIPASHLEPEFTQFAKVDTHTKTFTQLPVAADGANAALLAVGQDGRLLFAYGYKGEVGFGVTAPMA